MIIDVILDRRAYEREDKNFGWYDERQFRDLYDYATSFGFDYLASAIDGGTEKDVKTALCRYIDENGYRPSIKRYVRSVEWIPKGMD